jgi:tetratricopeptide (TPR) repeat protein
MSNYGYTFARPYSGSANPSQRLSGALHDVFRYAYERDTNTDKITASQIGTAMFFSARDVVQAAFKAVDMPHHAERRYSHFDHHYDVNVYDGGIAAYLKEIPEGLRQSLVFMIDLAVEAEVERKDVPRDDAFVAAFKDHMERLCAHYDLMDPRLSCAESVYSAQKLDVPEKAAQLDALMALQDALKTAKKARDGADTPLNDDMLSALCGVKDALRAVQRDCQRFERCKDQHESVFAHKERVAKTFLYSHVTSRMGDLGTEEFRDGLYEQLRLCTFDAQRDHVQKTMLGAVHERLGLSFFAIAQADDAKDIYKKIKNNMPHIAQDFLNLNGGQWALNIFSKLDERWRVLGAIVDGVYDMLDGVCYKDARGELALSPEMESYRQRRVQDLFARHDLSDAEQQTLKTFSYGTGVAEWSAKLRPMDYVAADVKMVNISRQFARAHNGDDGTRHVQPLSLSVHSKALMREYGIAVRASEKDPMALVAYDRKAHLEKFIIR